MARSDRTFLRPRDGIVLGGVCAALARAGGLDVYVVRTLVFAAFLASVIAAWLWLPLLFTVPSLYAVGWLAIPRE